MDQQDIVWIEVPFSDLHESKLRPALIVSNNEYNSNNADVLICAITSNLTERPYSVGISQQNLSEGQLPIQSKVRVDKVISVEKAKIVRHFAKLNDQTFDKVVKELFQLIKRS